MKKQISSDAGHLQPSAGTGSLRPSIEDEVFHRLRPDFARFPDAGFVEEGVPGLLVSECATNAKENLVPRTPRLEPGQ